MAQGTGVLLKVPADNGCKQATRFLREHSGDPRAQSRCLECPFGECKEVTNQWHADNVIQGIAIAKENRAKKVTA